MSSAANNCLTLLTYLDIQANSVDPSRSSLIWVHTICRKATKAFTKRQKQTTFVVIGAFKRINTDGTIALFNSLLTKSADEISNLSGL